ncbi:GGDEF domain-containing protein [Litoribrevibacter euphylliae]|uniref:diguanylate cyclase n=1 Tax=Litoribrevibacter euphylliae TaxID=1834034 RepID=A0ABV7HKI0_9GAMM
MTQFRTRITHFSNTIFDGSYVEKSQCIFTLIALTLGCFAILLSFTLLLTDAASNINRQGYVELLEISSVCSLYSLILTMIGNFIKDRESRWYAHVCVFSYVMVNVFILFYIGVYSMGTGIALAGAPIIGLILFDRRLIFTSLGSGLLIFIAFNVFMLTNNLEYAPIVQNQAEPYRDPIWLMTMLTFVSGHLGLLVFIGHTSISRWKEREAQVTFLSTTDPLTHLSNRRHLMEHYQQEYQRAIRQQSPLSIFLVDLDHFKQVNDTFGHLSGDEALKVAAWTLKDTLRETDLVGRYGGEEFLVILPDTDGRAAIQVADRFRRALQANAIELPDGQRLTITASIGLNTSIPKSLTDLDHFLASADKALYQAKNNGRNQVTIAVENEQAA